MRDDLPPQKIAPVTVILSQALQMGLTGLEIVHICQLRQFHRLHAPTALDLATLEETPGCFRGPI